MSIFKLRKRAQTPRSLPPFGSHRAVQEDTLEAGRVQETDRDRAATSG